jgi:hypothetical protein
VAALTAIAKATAVGVVLAMAGNTLSGSLIGGCLGMAEVTGLALMFAGQRKVGAVVIKAP